VGEGPIAAVSGSFALSPLVKKNALTAAMMAIKTTAPTIRRPVRLFIARALALRAPVLNVVVQSRLQSCVKPSDCFRNLGEGTLWRKRHYFKELFNRRGYPMGRYLLLWLLGVPIPILLLIWAFGGLH
jgi:hypothetical protein